MPRRLALLPLALLLTACQTTRTTTTSISGTPELRPAPAAAPAAAVPASAPVSAAVQPAGKWVLSLTAQGTPLELLLELVQREDGSWSGTVTSLAFPPFPVSKAVLTGNKMVATLAIPTGDDATMTLEFAGDVVTGEWAMPGDGSRLTGKRR